MMQPPVDRFVVTCASLDEQTDKRVAHHALKSPVMLHTHIFQGKFLFDKPNRFFTTPASGVFFDEAMAPCERGERMIGKEKTPLARLAYPFDDDDRQLHSCALRNFFLAAIHHLNRKVIVANLRLVLLPLPPLPVLAHHMLFVKRINSNAITVSVVHAALLIS